MTDTLTPEGAEASAQRIIDDADRAARHSGGYALSYIQQFIAATLAAKDEEIARLRSDRLELDRRIHNQRERLRQHEGWTASGARGAPAGGNGLGWRVSASRYLDIATRAHQARRAAESEVTRLRAELVEAGKIVSGVLIGSRVQDLESEVTRLKAELATRERRGLERAAELLTTNAAEIEAIGRELYSRKGIDGGCFLRAGHYSMAAAAIRSEASKLPAAGETGWRPTHQHYKGGLYRVIARGKIEADLSPCVVYDDRFGEVWVRPQTEFNGAVDENGYISRFAPLPAPPQSAAE